MTESTDFSLNCPRPIDTDEKLLIAHGGGGSKSRKLIETIILPELRNRLLEPLHDGAVFNINNHRLAFTTDSFVVHPLFFPGGDIGALAVNGTVNDLAMCGARPLYLSLGLILEEGFSTNTLRRIMQSLGSAADAAGVQIVTGDTKVVERGKGDGLYINTAGVGIIEHSAEITPTSIKSGDVIILSGDIGRHSVAVLIAREELAFENPIESDCAPLAEPVLSLIEGGVEISCLRDLTRGGLATALVELATSSKLQIEIDESCVDVSEPVRGVCEILGFDPLYLANEGRFVVIVRANQVDRTLEILQSHPVSSAAKVIGQFRTGTAGLVGMRTVIGSQRVIDMLSGEQLPRIC